MELLDNIYLQLDRAEALRDLAPRPRGDYLELVCPKCGERRAFIYNNGTVIKCNRVNDCNAQVSIFDYVKESKGLTENWDVIKELASIAGYTIPKSNGFSEVKYQTAKEAEDILENALSYFKAQLFTESGKEVLDYLTGYRGYKEDEIKAMELGFYPSQEELRKHLEVYPVNTVNNVLYTKNFGITHKLVIPFRDYLGRLKGFILRSLLPEAELKEQGERKYKYNTGLKPSSQFYNIDKNLREEALIIAEGYLDALIATQRGLRGVVSIGKAVPSKDQVEQAIRYGTKRFIFALDNDEDKEAVNERISKSLKMVQERGARGYIVSFPEGIKDPDELIDQKGIEAFKKAINEAETGSKWKVKSLLSKHRKHSISSLQDIDRDLVIDEALSYEETITDPIDSKDFIDALCKWLEIPIELFSLKVKDYHEKKARQRQKDGYTHLLSEAGKLLQEGKIFSIEKYIREHLQSIKAQGVTDIIEPYTEEQAYNDIRQKGEGLKTGINALDRYLVIQKEALTVIAGRPSHGKTTLKLNMFLNMIELYPDKRFFFFSYEQSKNELYIRLINILAGKQLDQYHNLQRIEAYIREGREDLQEIETAKTKYNKLVESGRLWLIEEPYYINDLTDTIDFINDKHGNIGACFIDYIQKIKIKEKYQSRQVEIQKVSEELLEASKRNHIPIIVGAQFNREVKTLNDVCMSNLRESGDIEQDANLILGLYNDAFTQAEESGERVSSKEINLTLKILKNRNGVVNEKASLLWDLPVSKIKNESG